MRRLLVGLAVLMIAGLASSWAHADDQQIAQEIVKQLRERQTQGVLRGFGIDLEVDNGAVWMKGYVSSQEQQRLVLDIARRVRGVQQVVNDLTITPQKTSKAENASENKRGASRPALPESEKSRPVLLTSFSNLLKKSVGADAPAGTTETVFRKETPAKPASPSPNRSDDSEQIAKRVVEKLKEQKAAGNLRHFDLTVKVESGSLSLIGTVASAEQQQLVLETARRIPGVKQVVNELKVASAASESKAPQAAQPASSPEVELTALEMPKTADSPETLERGRALDQSRLTAYTPLDLQAPENQAVSGQPGLLPVRGDRQIAAEIQGKLEDQKRQGNLHDFQMNVKVLDGQVWVAGQVPTAEQRRLVLDVARRVRGVVQVVNDLEVSSSNPAPTAQLAAASTAAAPQQVLYVPAGYGAQTPMAFAPARTISYAESGNVAGQVQPAPPVPAYSPVAGAGIAPARYDHPHLPGYAWPSYAAYPNYAGLTYPKQYSPTAWPYIGPFYPYPQVPLGWRQVTLEWDDGWWMLDFRSQKRK